MESLFVKYNQALDLKEIGFDEPCIFVHDAWGNTKNWTEDGEGEHRNSDKNASIYYSAPLKQQAFRWFRDKHQLFYTIETNCSQLSSEWGFDYTIYDKEKDKWLSTEPQNCPPGETTYKTYEEAESDCINKLIEIVKKPLVN